MCSEDAHTYLGQYRAGLGHATCVQLEDRVTADIKSQGVVHTSTRVLFLSVSKELLSSL